MSFDLMLGALIAAALLILFLLALLRPERF